MLTFPDGHLLGQFYPKVTNFAKLSQTLINRVVGQLNKRPRKRLGYRTQAEVFWGKCSGALEISGAAVIG